MPIRPVDAVQRRAVVLDLAGERLDAEREQQREREHDRGVAEREPEADGQRPLAVGHQLAGGVVDRRDVVGVEGVPQPERVRGDAEPDAEDLRAERVVVRGDEREQRDPADDVQRRRRPRPCRRRPAHSRRVSRLRIRRSRPPRVLGATVAILLLFWGRVSPGGPASLAGPPLGVWCARRRSSDHRPPRRHLRT